MYIDGNIPKIVFYENIYIHPIAKLSRYGVTSA